MQKEFKKAKKNKKKIPQKNSKKFYSKQMSF